jgi:hypothetical protein
MLELGLESEKRNQEINGSIIARLTKDNISTSRNEGTSVCKAVEREKRSITNRFCNEQISHSVPINAVH